MDIEFAFGCVFGNTGPLQNLIEHPRRVDGDKQQRIVRNKTPCRSAGGVLAIEFLCLARFTVGDKTAHEFLRDRLQTFPPPFVDFRRQPDAVCVRPQMFRRQRSQFIDTEACAESGFKQHSFVRLAVRQYRLHFIPCHIPTHDERRFVEFRHDFKRIVRKITAFFAPRAKAKQSVAVLVQHLAALALFLQLPQCGLRFGENGFVQVAHAFKPQCFTPPLEIILPRTRIAGRPWASASSALRSAPRQIFGRHIFIRLMQYFVEFVRQGNQAFADFVLFVLHLEKQAFRFGFVAGQRHFFDAAVSELEFAPVFRVRDFLALRIQDGNELSGVGIAVCFEGLKKAGHGQLLNSKLRRRAASLSEAASTVRYSFSNHCRMWPTVQMDVLPIRMGGGSWRRYTRRHTVRVEQARHRARALMSSICSGGSLARMA